MAVITKEQVFQTCDQLKQTQGRFTQAEVVAICGGSLSKVGPWVREWQQLDRATQAYSDLPPVLLDQLNTWCRQVKQALEQEAETPLAEAQEQIDTLQQQLVQATERAERTETSLEKALRENERLVENISALKRTERDMQKRLDSSRQQHSDEIVRLQAQLESATQRELRAAQDIKAQQSRADEQLKEERARITGIFEANENKLFQQLDQLRQTQQQEQAGHNKKLNELKEIRQTLEQKCIQLEQAGAIQCEQLALLQTQNEKMEEDAAKYQNQIQQQQERHRETEQQRYDAELALEGKLARAQGERDQAAAMGERLSLQVEQLQQQLIALVAQRQAPEH